MSFLNINQMHDAHIITIASPSRSGHNAVCNWIARGCVKPAVRLVNFTRDEFNVGAAEVWLYQNDDPARRVKPSNPCEMPHPLVSELTNAFVISFENRTFSEIDKHTVTPKHRVLLRSLRNLLASIGARERHEDLAGYARYLDPWKMYAKAYLSGSVEAILYDRWFASVSYREQLAIELQIENSDVALNEVSSVGGGSSFTGTDMNGKGSQMEVLTRYKNTRASVQHALNLIDQDPELLPIDHLIFGDY